MNSKILLLSIAVISVGLFAIPSTLSLYAGQHTFQGVASVDCTKCHADVVSELTAGSTAHTTISSGTNKCEGCHQANGTVNSSIIPMGNFTGNFSKNDPANATLVGWNATTGNFTYPNGSRQSYQAHAAITIECVFCHQAVNTSFLNDAHKSLADNATTASGGVLKGQNAVCITCHTKSVKTIIFQRYNGTTITYSFTNKSLNWSNGVINTTTVNP